MTVQIWVRVFLRKHLICLSYAHANDVWWTKNLIWTLLNCADIERKKYQLKCKLPLWHLNSKVSVKFPFSKAWMVAASGWVHMHCPRPLCNSAPLAQLKHKPGLARPTVTYNNTLFSTNKESTAPRHLWPTSTTVHLSVSPPHQLLAPHTNFQPPKPTSSPPTPPSSPPAPV